MNTLIIDCSNGLYVQTIVNGKSFVYTDENSKQQSDSLLDKVDLVLNNANISIKDINIIAVCVGPGSFTGIRVTISTAKGLAIGSNAKIVVFNSFQTISQISDHRNYGVIVDGFGNNYYYYFKKFGKIFQGCASADKLEVLARDIPVFSTSEKVCKNITNFLVSLAEYNATICVNNAIQNKQFVSTNQIVPLYLRASQAELERLKNGNQI